MTARTAASESAALRTSSRPVSDSRCSGSRRGPSSSVSTITGTPSRKTEPHQANSSTAPPASGPIAAPDAVARRPHADRERALARVLEEPADQGQRRRRDHRARQSEQRAGRDQQPGAGRERGQDGEAGERRGADHQHAARADAVAERAHRDQRARDHEPVDVDDPQQLRAARLEVGADRRQREIEHVEVHRVDQAGERDHGEAEPVAAGSSSGGHCVRSGRSPIRYERLPLFP